MARTAARPNIRNPLAVDPDHENRVRERAYHLWESEGRPHGRDVEYWERARELVGTEESSDAELMPIPETTPVSPQETKVEKAGIQENRAESSGRLADQGEVKATPSPKRKGRTKSKK